MVFTPSEYQQGIFDFIQNGSGHGVLVAVAGSGKSETIKQGVNGYIPRDKKVCVCAYNSHIQVDLRAKFPAHVDVVTLHSMGLSALRNVGLATRVNANKVKDMAKASIPVKCPGIIKRDTYAIVSFTAKVISSMKNMGIVRPTCDDIYYVMETYSMELPLTVSKQAGPGKMTEEQLMQFIITTYAQSLYETSSIDFDDMIFMPHALGIRIRAYDYVFVDEAQDLNRVQKELVLGAIKDGGRIIAVGDPNQSMYAFRGADPNSMPELQEILHAANLPLSITYRCPRSHVELAREIVPHIEAAEWAKEGTIDDMNYEQYLAAVEPGSLTICRYNAPLIKAAIAMIRKGKKAVIKGKDISKNVKSTIEHFSGSNFYMSLPAFKQTVVNWYLEAIKQCAENGEDPKIHADKYETVMSILESIHVKNVGELLDFIDRIFQDTNQANDIMLSTVHGAKGLEADHVYILGRELMPHRHPRQQDWEIIQEYNILYVALTRSKDVMTMVHLK